MLQVLAWQAAYDAKREALILVASDERLPQPTQTEDFAVFNPEASSPGAVEALLNG